VPAVVVAGLALSGCAERKLVTEPTGSTSAATWVVVAAAAALAAAVAGVLITLPAWRGRGGSRLAVALLSAQAGVVAVGGAVLVGAAVRTWQLFDRPLEQAASPALLRLSRVDGDTAFLAIMVLVVVVLGGLLLWLLALSARFAATGRTAERVVASSVLAVQVLVGVAGVALLLIDGLAWPYAVAAVHAPLAAAAAVDCWPRPHPGPDPA